MKRQTKIPSGLLSDAAKYLKNDIYGNKIDVKYKDINGDKIKDCYFVVLGKQAKKGFKGTSYYGYNDSSISWSDVAVVLQSSKKGIVVKFCKPSEAKKLFK